MSNFVPEMHDIGKLIPTNIQVDLTEGQTLKSHDDKGPSFRNLDWAKFGAIAPTNATWLGVIYHIDKITGWVRDLQESPIGFSVSDEDRARLFLLVLADHLAATAGRALSGAEGGGVSLQHVHRLWHPNYAKALRAADGKNVEAEPINNVGELRRMLQWISTDPADEREFEIRHKLSLLCKPEDEGTPRNVTSLYSHSWLTGKFYRVLEHYVTLKTDPLRLEFNQQPVTVIVQREQERKIKPIPTAEQDWVCCLVRASVHFPQQPVRPADLGVFDRLNDAHKAFAATFPDNLLFAAGDDLWLFAPPEPLLSLAELFKPFTERGFYVTAAIKQAVLADLKVWSTAEGLQDTISHYEQQRVEITQRLRVLAEQLKIAENDYHQNSARIRQMSNEVSKRPLIERNQQLSRQRDDLRVQQTQLREEFASIEQAIPRLAAQQNQTGLIHRSYYPASLSQSFEPPLCEVCQMRHGEPKQFGKRTDYLCTDCETTRNKGFSQRQLTDRLNRELESAEQERAQPRMRYLWLRVSLAAAQLEATVVSLFGQYVDSITSLSPAQRLPLKTELRLPSLLRDFVDDYHNMLNHFDARIRRAAKNAVRLRRDSNLWVAPLESGQQVEMILLDYLETLNQFYPVFVAGKQPTTSCIQFSGSIANAIFPFFEHWRYLQHPHQPINLRLVGSMQLELGLESAAELVTVKRNEGKQQSAFLHRVAVIEQKTQSHFLVQAAFMDEKTLSETKGRPVLPAVKLYESGLISAEQILAYHKLTDWG